MSFANTDAFAQYTDLEKEPAFDLEALLQDHTARERDSELARSQAAALLPKQKGAKGAKRDQKVKAMAEEEEADGESWDTDDEMMEHKLNVVEKARRQNDDEGSYNGGDVEDIEPRAKSSRSAPSRKRVLEDFVVEEESPEAPQDLSPVKVKRGKAKSKGSTGKATVCVPVPPAAPPAAASRGKKARSPAARVSDPPRVAPTAAFAKIARGATKKVARAAVGAAPAPTTAFAAAPAALPLKKRRLDARSAAEIDADEMEAVEELPDVDMIGKLLVPHLAHVCTTIVDDYVRLLGGKGKVWPAGMLVETTGRWLRLEALNAAEALRSFAANGRLAGVNQVLWPMYSESRAHFALLVINVRAQTIRVLDSIIACRPNWDLRWLQELMKRAFGWKNDGAVTLENCRVQDNNDDCGVYVMGNLRSFWENVDFNHRRMPGMHLKKKKFAAVLALRQHFASELLAGKLSEWK